MKSSSEGKEKREVGMQQPLIPASGVTALAGHPTPQEPSPPFPDDLMNVDRRVLVERLRALASQI